MSERLIMLDVPGVLFSERSAARLGGKPETGAVRELRLFDPVALGFVRRLFGLAGARVVLPHAWGVGARSTLVQQLDLQVHAFAPAAPGGFGAEVAAYLASAQPTPQNFVVLTADSASVDPSLQSRLIALDPANGLTLDDFKQALDLLGVACPNGLYPPTQPDPRLQARLQQLRRAARHGALPGLAPSPVAEPAHA
ncbi:HAD domain-containing protein [Cupriavidus sp. UGS-1]|uniref:HAD domain-containing protein n=1 Tax=Cupriavidus sp. UGS-1 TaxID=2899826 RepID=UPI001E3EC6E5|nr:HAD domain-containing protein [Cupriavidus sp. UGS-1]MCD9120976.1 hypothetical protein [Cupriavidus sp. UGS-1]